MVRTLEFVLIGALIATAGWTFKVKHDGEKIVAGVEALETRIRLEREAIDILKADWSLLASPDRLQALIERHRLELGLDPLQPAQIVTIDKIPEKPPAALPPLDGGEQRADVPDTNAVTGTVTNTADGVVSGRSKAEATENPE